MKDFPVERIVTKASTLRLDSMGLAVLFYKLADLPTPVIAVVQGAAIGGGLGLTVASDFVLAEETAVFATSEVLLGIVPGVISPYVIRKIGLAAAAPLMLTGGRIGAREAAASGLATQVAPAAELENALQAVLLDFLAAGQESQRATKNLLTRAQPLPGPELI